MRVDKPGQLQILLTFLLWFIVPRDLFGDYESYSNWFFGAFIILAIVWLFVGDTVRNWYASTDSRRKNKRIRVLKTKLIKLNSRHHMLTSSPNRFFLLLFIRVLHILFILLMLILYFTYSAPIDDFAGIISNIIGLFLFFTCYYFINNLIKTYLDVYDYNRVKRSIEASIQELVDDNAKKRKKDIVIVKAVYQAKEYNISRDVTEEVRGRVLLDNMAFVVGNDLVGNDIAVDTKKELRLRYKIRGKTVDKVVDEGEKIQLDDSP